jgi:segregation and condensation protein B
MDNDQTTAEDLERSYAAVMEQAAWQEEGDAKPSVVAAPPAEELPPDPLRIIEALLFVGGQPLKAERACEIVRGLAPEQFLQAVDTLNHSYRRQGRPYTILAQDHGYLLTLKPSHRGVIEKVYGGPREARLSMAAIDVLSLVAYRQPASKADVDSLRGAESGSLLRQLVRRGLVQVVQEEGKPKSEVVYVTTPRFLQLFGLGSLEDLPRTQDPQQM